MAEYIDIPIETDPNALAEIAFDKIQSYFPDWVPDEANLDTWMVSAFAAMASVVRDLASTVPTSIFRYFGATVLGIPPLDGAAAATTTTWVMVDNAGYTIPSGTNVGIRNSSGDIIAFYVTDDVVVPAGSTTTAAGEVSIVAREEDATGTALGGAGVTVELLDSLAFVSGITMTAATTGGVDAEDDADYLDRLATEMALMAPRPILPADFADMMKNITGIWRVLALDGYNPADDTYNNERMIALAGLDSDGVAITGGLKTAADTYLQARREVNFVVNIIDPTFTDFDIQYTATVFPGYDAASVKDVIDAALLSFVSGARWGVVPTLGERSWVNQTKLRINDLIVVAGSQEGVDDITDMKIREHATGSYAATDVTLTGAAPVARTQAGYITGTVT